VTASDFLRQSLAFLDRALTRFFRVVRRFLDQLAQESAPAAGARQPGKVREEQFGGEQSAGTRTDAEADSTREPREDDANLLEPERSATPPADPPRIDASGEVEDHERESFSPSQETPVPSSVRDDAEQIEPLPLNHGDAGKLRSPSTEQVDEPPLHRPEPFSRGGRPRQSESANSQGEAISSPQLKPEVVCKKIDRVWVVGVAGEQFDRADTRILQNDQPLTLEGFSESLWRLRDIGGKIRVLPKNGENRQTERRFDLGDEAFWVFKLRGREGTEGRRVKRVSYGTYLAVVPDRWKRNTELSGDPPIHPETCSLKGYLAHFFFLRRQDGRGIAFQTEKGDHIVAEAAAAKFELIGHRLIDAAKETGPLFGEAPPVIKALNSSEWAGIKTIVVGAEGVGQGKWRTQFTPDRLGSDQPLPDEVRLRGGGWYFARLYDTSYTLVESFDFRFLNGLTEIVLDQPLPFPPIGETHGSVDIELKHHPDVSILATELCSSQIATKKTNLGTKLQIPANPECDRSRWTLTASEDAQIALGLVVERVWWGIGTRRKEPPEWTDQQVELRRGDFRNKELWLLLPSDRWTMEILAGLDGEQGRSYKVPVEDRKVIIPLLDFSDSVALSEEKDCSLWVRLEARGRQWSGAPCRIPLCLVCAFCENESSEVNDLLDHIRSCHVTEVVRPLTYEELRERNPDLPVKIYQCGYCSYYVITRDELHPTSAIVRHQERECDAARRRDGTVLIKFEPITDVERIRENVIRGLPNIRKCTLCTQDLGEINEDTAMTHLVLKHLKQLYVRID
jgi:hypothetical protein